MPANPDITVHSPDGRVQVVIEVKSKRNASSAWVAQMRRNLVAHAMLPQAEYFLLVLPDQVHVWRDTTTPDEIPPILTIPTSEAFGAFGSRFTPEELGERGLELLTTSWLDDLTRYVEAEGQENNWLVRTGLARAVRGGRVETSAAA